MERRQQLKRAPDLSAIDRAVYATVQHAIDEPGIHLRVTAKSMKELNETIRLVTYTLHGMKERHGYNCLPHVAEGMIGLVLDNQSIIEFRVEKMGQYLGDEK
jgi:hypothetical protein